MRRAGACTGATTRPTTGPRGGCPPAIRPATHALYGYVRTADEIVDGPRRAPSAAARRAALDDWERELERGLAADGSAQPVVRALVDAGRRHRLPLGELRTYMSSMRDRLRARADRDVAGARVLHGRLGRLRRPDHGAAARRPRRATTPATGGSARPSSSRTSSATCARTRASTGSTCPREDRARFGVGEDALARDHASPELRALLAFEVRRAHALFAEAEPAIAAAPELRAQRRALRGRRLPARARPRRADRVRRAGPPLRRARSGSSRAPRSARCGDDPPRHAARRGAHAAGGRRRARRRAGLRRELRRARRRARAGRLGRRRARPRPLRDRRAPDVGLRRADPLAGGDGRARRRSARSCRAWPSTRRTARPASGCRGAGRRSTTATLCRELWAQCDGARFAIAKVERRAGAACTPTGET